jgi:hypothetical protein
MAIPTVLNYEGGRVNFLPLDPDRFLNKSTNLYGGSGSGKTVILREILCTLQHRISDFYVFAGTTGTSDDSFFSPDVVPSPMLYSVLDMEKISNIVSLQELRIKLYKSSRNPEYLLGLADACGPSCLEPSFRNAVQTFVNNRAMMDPTRSARLSESIVSRLQAAILAHKARATFDQAQKRVISFFGQEVPTVGIIFDDLAVEISALKGHDLELLTNLYTKGRHYKITFFMVLQDITYLKTPLRSNGMINIFTCAGSASKYFMNKNTSTDRPTLDTAKKVTASIFERPAKHFVLVYLKDDPVKFYYTKARDPRTMPRIRLGAQHNWELARRLEEESNKKIKLSASNPYKSLLE